ncbi:focadhesin isoform X2 [Latimeria chalumnae]|uniref:focadhesin isoform X2 n=1 Tax=Latimeria chalumnae TaxID=7897 RepID=UPI00313D7B5D
MSDDLRKRFEFPHSLIQSQAVGHLVAAVLKENVLSDKINQSSSQTPALNLLWEKCCSDNVVVRTTCCEALMALVAQNHADFNYVLNGILNLIPSARNLQGLVKGVGKLLQLQAIQIEKLGKEPYECPYAIRNPPHPYISILENRPDCWPYLLQQIPLFLQQYSERVKCSCFGMMIPFLRYLYCEPSHLRELSELRMSLLKVLLHPQDLKKNDEPGMLEQHILRLLLGLVPHLQINDLVQVTEAVLFLEELSSGLLRHPSFWRDELSQISLQLLCLCEVSLRVAGECSSLIHLIEQNTEILTKEFPSEQIVVGLSILLLQTPSSQWTSILKLASKIFSCVEADSLSAAVLVLVMPLLQILSSGAVVDSLSGGELSTCCQELALNLLEMVQMKAQRYQQSDWKLMFPVTSWYSTVFTTWELVDSFKEESAACDWLSSIKSLLPLSNKVPEHVTLLVAYIIVKEDGECLHRALNAATELAQADSAQVPNLVPVLMFKLGRPLDPALYHAILYTLPALGTHKVCVAQILHALKMLGNAPKLRAVALRLMTALWEKQDRVYPELQKFMALIDKPSLSIGKEDHWEQIIAKAASIRDICKHRPYQHGADMLAAISLVLSECTKPDQATPAVLVLQGLHALCQAEVVDIRSTWNALSPKLSCDMRPLTVKALTEFFALVPSLTVKTPEYEKFKVHVVSILWLHTQSKARPEIKTPDSEEEVEENDEEGEKEEDLSVPGASYIKLLLMTAPAVLTKFEVFLTSLVMQEMANMPRGVYHSALRGVAVRSDQGKTVAGVPSFMLKTYEKNKQPGLKNGLAAGTLLCYELPIQTDKDGKPINRFLVSRGRSYQQMLSALIHEVHIQPSEWHRACLLPQAWLGFMSRTYNAVLQGRQAELEIQLKHAKDDPQELQYKQFTAWLWVRDLLTDAVKSASKDSSVVQGNCILALTGLAVAVSKYEASLPSETEGTPEIGAEILPTKHWFSMVLDTLLSIVESRYHPKGRVFPWFQHKSYSGENTASAIARSCAATALSLLVPVLITAHKDSIEEILNILAAGLPGRPAADESQAVQFHTGLAMGMFLSRLYEEKVSDVSSQKMNLLLMKSLDALESCCFDTSLEYNTGCILGVCLVLSLMSHSSQTESRVHVSVTLNKLCNSLDESAFQSRMLQEILAYSVACVSISAFSVGIIQANEAEEIINKLRALTEQNQQTPGFALALGVIVNGLAVCGHGKAEDLSNRLLPAWIKILLAEGCSTMQRLAAVNGLVTLLGSETSLIQLKSETIQSSQFQSKLNEVIRTITQIISFSGVIGLQSNAAWLLGHLHLANLSASQSRTSVPPDFSYLSEKSVIRAATDYIVEAGKKGPETIPSQMIKVILGSIATAGSSYQYPPVNWAAILSPLMRLNFGEEIQRHSIEIAVTQAQSSQSATMFLGMWLTPPLVHSLSMSTKKYLCSSVSLWMKQVPEDKLQLFAKKFGAQYFTAGNRHQNPDFCQVILEGLSQAMELPNPAQFCWSILCKTVEKIFELLPNKIQRSEVELYIKLSKCLSEMADTEIDRITQVSKDNIEKATFIRAYLVSQGRVPLLSLNDILGTAVRCNQTEAVSWMLLQCFYQARLIAHQNTGVMTRIEWLLELMGHIRNVASGTTPLENTDLKRAVDFLLQIFAVSVVAWADHTTPLLLGVSANWFPWKQEEAKTANCPVNFLGCCSLNVLSVQGCLTVLPCSIQLLLAKEPWKEHTQKFIDWLFSIWESPKKVLSETSKNVLKATLLNLRFLPEFKKKAVWTRAYGW